VPDQPVPPASAAPAALDDPQPLPTDAVPTASTDPAPSGELPAVTSAPDGSVTGVAWFDRNDNGSVDPREWLLPAVPVTLTAVPALRTAGLLRTQAAPASYSRTVTTGTDGSYRFTGLPPGAYRVTAVLHEPGFAYTSDTDGLADWQVGVAVTTRAPGVADFAGLGTGRLTGQVLDTVERHPVAAADVRCTWAGFDDVFGTTDDVVMTDVADTRGSYDWSGVPYGAFTCVGKDPVRGTVSAAATVKVVSAVPVHATLPLGTRVDVAARWSALPRTGWSADTAAAGAAWLILLGVGVLWYTQRQSDR
jgi:hypothetical protein